MSRINRNFVLAYAFLVILPLVGLAGILKNGRSLTAPVSIDGLWTLQVDSAQLDSLPCGRAAIPDKTVVISQSGKSFELRFPNEPKVTASGTLNGITLRATLMQPESETGCSSERQFLMLATVDRRADGSSLAGTLSIPNCSTCAFVGFRAQSQAPPTPRGDH